jgi:hypothetical protein
MKSSIFFFFLKNSTLEASWEIIIIIINSVAWRNTTIIHFQVNTSYKLLK